MKVAPDVASIIAGFPNPVIQKVIGRPNYKQLARMMKVLKMNAASVLTTFGGGQHGHVGLMFKPTEYTTATGARVAFTMPADPG